MCCYTHVRWSARSPADGPLCYFRILGLISIVKCLFYRLCISLGLESKWKYCQGRPATSDLLMAKSLSIMVSPTYTSLQQHARVPVVLHFGQNCFVQILKYCPISRNLNGTFLSLVVLSEGEHVFINIATTQTSAFGSLPFIFFYFFYWVVSLIALFMKTLWWDTK
jgi:hypothetical protein